MLQSTPPARLSTTTSDDLDSGASAGWDIADTSVVLGTEVWASFSRSFQIAVKGTLQTTTTNAAPTASNKTVTTNEDTDYTFAAADFSFEDTDTGDTLSSVKIVTLPATGKGALELDGTAIASTALPQTVTKADIDGNKLKYSPPANANGDDYASFTFKVNDGTDDSATANTMTIDVTEVNDPATGLPTITGTAQVGQTLTAVTTGIMDADGLPDSFLYAWSRVMGLTVSLISGATSSTYTLVEADEGHEMRVDVSFIDDGGTLENTTSVDGPTVQPAATTNAAPTVANVIADRTATVGTFFSYLIPANTFADTDTGDTLTYTATKSDDTALPSWMSFSASQRILSGTPAAGDVGTVTVKVTANDGRGGSVSDEFDIVVSAAAAEADRAGTVALASQPEMGIPMTATLTDPDGSISGTTWQWSSSATASGTFADISGATSATYSPAEADLTKFLRATASYTDALASGKSAMATAANAVRASRVHIVSTLSQVSGNPRYEKPGIATQFTTGAHPGGYKLSDVRIRLRGTYTASSFQAHIYDSDSSGNPDESVYQLENPASISGVTSFDAPSGTRLAPNTTYHLAMVRTSGNVECETATADAYDSEGLASDWSTGGAYALTSQGAYDNASNTLGCGMRLSGQAAIDTSHITDLEITSSPAVAAGYATGETLEATVTFSEAVTVDTTTPPTLKVVIGSNTRTMTYNATDSSSTALQFDYTVVAADKDGNGASFNEDALTGTITRTSDSKAADLDHVADDSDARVNMPPEVTISFGSATYSVDEGGGVFVTVTLSAAPQRNLTIPLTASFQGGATAADFDAENKTQVPFESHETSLMINYRTEEDTVADHGESVRLSFGTLPLGVTASGTTTTTITIIDDDPAVTVDIGAQDSSVTEGGSGKLAVVLSEDPKRPVVIPITATGAGGATSVDYSVQATVTFNSGQTFKEIPFTATGDTDPDHGESVEFGFGSDLPPGVTEGTETTVTVTIIDDDPAVTVSFGSATHTGAEGDAVMVTVSLSAAPQRPLTIPITLTPLGGATPADVLVTRSVSFGTGDTEQQFDAALANDSDADHGESLRFSFGTLPPGVTASGTTTTTITIIDNDPAVEVEFGSTTYSAAEGTATSVTVTLSEDPKRPLTIPITSTAQGSTTADDYTFTATEVTFASGQTSRTLSFSALQDTTPDDGDSVKLGFGTDLPPGVTEGTDDETTVTIIDDDPAVTVSFGAATYSVDESGSVDVTLTLSEDPQRTVIIPIDAAGQSGATAADYEPPGSVTFDSGDTTKTLTFTPENDTVDDDGEKVRLSLGLLPPGVSPAISSSNPVATVISINDDDDPEVTVRFGSATYSVNEKNNGTVTVTVGLSADPERTVSIPLTTVYAGGADSNGIRGIPNSVSFNATETSKTFVVTGWDDFIDNDGRTATITFGTLPSRVEGGTIDETVVSVTDDDTRGFQLQHETSGTVPVGENATITYTILMKSEPTSTVTVTINDPTDSDDASASPATLEFTAAVFAGGEPLTVTVTTTDDELDEPDETATVTHSVSGGDYGDNNVTIRDFVITITDDDETPVITGSTAKNFPEIEYDDDSPDLEVATYSATDGDGDDITWSLSGTDSGFFEYEEDSDGDLVLSFDGDDFAGEGPDFEDPEDDDSLNTYQVTVEASDGTNMTTRAVTITVTNVNEKPSFSLEGLDLEWLENPYHEEFVNRSTEFFIMTDPEGTDDLTLTIVGLDGAHISTFAGLLSGSFYANIYNEKPLDYENPLDDDKDNHYEIVVRGSDGVNVTDVPATVVIRNTISYC